MNKRVNLFLAVILCFSVLAGCASNEVPDDDKGNTPPKPPGEKGVRTDIIVGQASDVVSPDPHEQNDTNSNRVIRMMYDALLFTDFEGNPQPALAESWEQKSETEYSFKIRKGVKFHNGDELTPEDIKFSIERQLESPRVRAFVDAISEVTLEGDDTVIIKTAYPYSPLLYNLGATQSSIISKKHFEKLAGEKKKYADDPIGTGPMKYKEWKPNDHFTVVKFDDYWGEKAVATSVEMRIIPESSSRTIALETGEIDMLENVGPIDVKRVSENQKLTVLRQPSPAITYVASNITQKPFDNVKVRQALSHATNKADIIEVVCEGYALEANTVMPSTSPGFDSELNLYPYDVEKAKALLSEAGYPNGFKAELATSGDERNRIAQLLQSDYSKINVEIDINLMEWGAYLDYISQKTHQMFIVGWSYSPEPDSSVSPLFHSKSGGPTGNRMWYSNPEVDALIEQGRTLFTWEEREPIYKELQKKVMEDAAWIPLFAKETIIAMNKNLEGVRISPIDSHIFVYAQVKE